MQRRVEATPVNMILLRKLKTFCLGSRGLVKVVEDAGKPCDLLDEWVINC